MKTISALFVVSWLSLLVQAHSRHDGRNKHPLAVRQEEPAPADPTPSNQTSAAQPSFTFSLRATNPTAVPLSSIVSGVENRPTRDLPTTETAGARPTGVANAPGLPDLQAFRQVRESRYPTYNEVPPVDSPEVLIWKDEVSNSGIEIPSFGPTTDDGSCEANAAIAMDPERCWWTCGACDHENDISACSEKNHWGLTFDDGPAIYTPDLLQYLAEANLKATFFVVGSAVYFLPEILQAEYIAGHQIAIHSWSHRPLTTLTDDEIIAELGWSKQIIKDVIGVTPTQFRPPYGDIDNRVRAIALAMGLTPVMWTRSSGFAFNTQDFDVNGGQATVEQVLSNWGNIIESAASLDTGFISLQHDLYQQAVDVATGYILPDGLAHQPRFTIEPIITCVNMPLANSYIETNNNRTNPFAAQLGVRSSPTPTPNLPEVTGSGGGDRSPEPGSGPDNNNGNPDAAQSVNNSGATIQTPLSVLALVLGLLAAYAQI
ncbi:glycoside hydrolase/deacetylase [Coprinopsis marcescibilis]|uniref:chitin deacetylase n=1 Tax=Coprinopsis marcescibilis TaxID=230819 RepID=A0A5C3KU98_COPMA|nr:glycoside hydrolase/deacetylase [Coprinopsis marcescibilis]